MIYPDAPWLDMSMAISKESGRGTLYFIEAGEITSLESRILRTSMTSVGGYTDITAGNQQTFGVFKISVNDTNFNQMDRLRKRWWGANNSFNFYPYPDDSNWAGTYYRCYFASPFRTSNFGIKRWNLDFNFVVINEPYTDGFTL